MKRRATALIVALSPGTRGSHLPDEAVHCEHEMLVAGKPGDVLDAQYRVLDVRRKDREVFRVERNEAKKVFIRHGWPGFGHRGGRGRASPGQGQDGPRARRCGPYP